MEPQQTLLWKFVGLASTIAGIICYALSSSSNHLLGGWKLWKVLVYSVFSVIICLLILFSNLFPRPASLQFKAHIAFFILTITSVYSFFFDKALDRKPDTWGLISCAAFAVMSLSLSRQKLCGFEVDLLYFFLGALIVDLMMIKLLLCVIGLGFSYFLIMLRSSLDDGRQPSHEPSDGSLSSLDSGSRIFQDSNQHVIRVDPDSEEAVQAVSDSQQANTGIALTMPQLTTCLEVMRANNKKVVAMLSNRVKEYIIAEVDSSDEVDENLVIDALQSDMMRNLREAVEPMVARESERECCDAYSKCRRECLKECLELIGGILPSNPQRRPSRRVSITEINFLKFETEDWSDWIKTSIVTTRLLFPNERRLCEEVFKGFPAIADLAFTEVCRELATGLLDFPNRLADGRTVFKTLEDLPRIPEVLKALHDLIPVYKSLFSERSSDSIRNEAINTWKKLGKATKNIFKRLEDWIRHDTATVDIRHLLDPISKDVMKCLSDICGAWNALGLEQVFEEHPMLADGEGTSSPFSTQLARIIKLLDTRLEDKSKYRANSALRHVFMMNNEWHILQKAIGYRSRMSTFFQDDVIEEIKTKFKQNLKGYKKNSWDEVIGILKQSGNEQVAESMIENIKLFNTLFEKIWSDQSGWLVPDEQLREKIIGSIKKILQLPYGNFTRRWPEISGSLGGEKIEFLTWDDIDARLNDLFRGSMPMNQ